jgi:hypothetical protein
VKDVLFYHVFLGVNKEERAFSFPFSAFSMQKQEPEKQHTGG